MRYLLIMLAALLLPSAAHAEWFEASSAHFVVYADDDERDIRRFSEQLERYHAAMEIVTGLKTEAPSPSNRVTVFMVRGIRQVERLAGESFVAGFYMPRAGAPVAFVPRVEARNGQPDIPMIALLHEYAHHFLMSNSNFPGPRWFSEGGAEFFASAEFDADGGVSIGMPAAHRGYELELARNVPVADLVDPEAYEKHALRRNYDAFYGKSWALYHYLIFTPERSGQLRAYVQEMAGGKTSREAAEAAFGDLDQLERELKSYLDQRTMLSLHYRPDQIQTAPISLRQVSAGEAELMWTRIRLERGVNHDGALKLVEDVRKVAARFPDDAAVLTLLAKAEYDAGNDAEAIAAADASLALDPGQTGAYVQKGYALFRRAAEAEDKVAAYRAAVQPFVALNKIENDHPLPLIYYFRSFADSGRRPSVTAVQGLERAVQLAPFDNDVRVMLASYQLGEGHVAEARANFLPVASDPHAGTLAERARVVIDRIDAGTPPDAAELRTILAPDAKPEANGGTEGRSASSGEE